MVLTLYGLRFLVGGMTTVLMTLAEKRIPFELVFVDLRAGENKLPAHLARQPFGQVPVLDDAGFVLYESRAICRYLEAKYPSQGPPLIPAGTEPTARFEQAASVEFANFEPHARAVYVQRIVQPLRGLEPDETAVAAALAGLAATLEVYERILGTQKFLAGDEFTLVDLFHVAFGAPLAAIGCDLMTTSGPNVARWWADVLGRPAWKSVRRSIGADVNGRHIDVEEEATGHGEDGGEVECEDGTTA
ncbi:glutathione S-transferase-like protein [Mycena rebaudengoi]|nr:glutathione S-transferase-like protein [Mycena rebaudengoi]